MVFQIPVKKNILPELTIKINKNRINNANVLTVANNKEPHEETNRGPDNWGLGSKDPTTYLTIRIQKKNKMYQNLTGHKLIRVHFKQ